MNLTHLAASLTLLAAPSFAQGGPAELIPQSPFSYQSCFVWPSFDLGDPEPPIKVLAAQCDRDGLPDGVLQVGHHLAFIGAIASRDIAQWITMDSNGEAVKALANDFDMPRDLVGVGGGFSTVQDAAVAFVNEKGLFVTYLEPALTTESLRAQQLVTTHLLAGAWAGAKFVRARDMNADGITDFAGITSDGVTVVFTDGASLATSTFVSPGTVEGFEVLRWDNNSTLEIAVLIAAKVAVMRLDGSVFNLFPDTVDAPGSIAVLAGTSRDRIAWARPVTGSGNMLTVLRWNGSPDVSQGLPISSAAAIGAGDLEYDRDDDIAISNTETLAPLFVRNDMAAPQFAVPNFAVDASNAWIKAPYDAFGLDANNHIALNTGVGDVFDLVDPNNKFRPLFKDLDNDGRGDVVVAAYTEGEISDHALALSIMSGVPPESEEGPQSLLESDDPCEPPFPSNKIYRGSMELDPDYIDTTGLRFTLDMTFNANTCPNYADHLRINMWYQPADDQPLVSQAIRSWQIPIDRVLNGWNPSNGDDTRLTMFVPSEVIPADLGVFDTYSAVGTCSETYTSFCMQGVVWFEVQTLQLNAPNVPIVYHTRFVAFDYNAATSPLVLSGGQRCCNDGTPSICVQLSCPESSMAITAGGDPQSSSVFAANGPIQIIRKPRLPSVGATEFPEVPANFDGVGTLGSP